MISANPAVTKRRKDIYRLTPQILQNLLSNGIFPHKEKVRNQLRILGYKISPSTLSGQAAWSKELSDMIGVAQFTAKQMGLSSGKGNTAAITPDSQKDIPADFRDCWRHRGYLWRIKPLDDDSFHRCDRTDEAARFELQRKQRGGSWEHGCWLSEKGVRELMARRD